MDSYFFLTETRPHDIQPTGPDISVENAFFFFHTIRIIFGYLE